jgi:hypothetical protein
MGSGLVKRIFWTSVLEVAIVLALILALTPRLGLAGLALAGLIGNALIGFAYFVAGACALARLKLAPYLWRTLGRPVIGGLPALIVGIWLAGNVDLDGWIGAAACVAATGLCGVVGVAWTTMSRWERARYAAAVRRVLAPTPARGRGWRGG